MMSAASVLRRFKRILRVSEFTGDGKKFLYRL
jgi:hypothetical protein